MECCLTLSKIVLNNSENQQHLVNHFSIEDVIGKFIEIADSGLKLRALLALSLFAYNNLENQHALKKTKSVQYESFRPFIESASPMHAAMACFQVARHLRPRLSLIFTHAGYRPHASHCRERR